MLPRVAKPRLTDLSLEALTEAVQKMGSKPYVASQLLLWLYDKCVSSFEEMTNLSNQDREKLAATYDIDAVTFCDLQQGSDGTKKILFELHDGKLIESVLIPNQEDERMTACISSQVGCGMACSFCRTGEMGLVRNLSLGEIVGQMRLLKQRTDRTITNVVFMGMGEPLANEKAVGHAVEILRSQKGFNFGRRRITLSTSGLLPQLKRFTEHHDIKIAISLSAVTDELRNELMPINKRYPIAEIMAFCREYTERTKKDVVTFEYVLIKGVNDRKEDAEGLVKLLHGVRAKVNLIPMNPFAESSYERPDAATVEWWRNFLKKHGVRAPVRISGGTDILAACGQLATASRRNFDKF